MKYFILLITFLAAFTASAQPANVAQECRAIVSQPPQGFVASPAQWLITTEFFDLERCSDVQFKGGGVVIRFVLDGKRVVKYIPAYRIESVVVETKAK